MRRIALGARRRRRGALVARGDRGGTDGVWSRRDRRSSIGWAFDARARWRRSTARRSPRRSCASSRSNAKGGVGGRQLQIKTCDTQGNKPAVAKACARQAARPRARTSSSPRATSTSRRRSCRRRSTAACSTIAPCIGTDQMGPKRFGAKGKLAFSFGNVAQDEGSAMAQYAWGNGWRTAALATDTRDRLLQERHPGVQGALHAARRQDRRPGDVPVARRQRTSRTSSAGSNDVKADVSSPRRRARSARCRRFVSGLRSARQQHADPQLVGRRRHVLAAEEPEGDELLLRHVRAMRSATTRTRRSTSSRSRSRRARAASSPARPRSTASSTAIQRGRAARRTARRSPRRWRSFTRCRRCRASSASRRSCTRCSGGSTA